MNRFQVLLLSLVASTFFLSAHKPSLAQSNTSVQVGVLNCSVQGGTGFIVGSTKTLSCQFNKQSGSENYRGQISKFGLDIGQTTQSTIAWAVFAPSVNISSGALQGNYGGVTAEATVGVGLGANVLVGGSSQSIALQPVSVQAQQGLNIAAGVAALELRWIK